MKLPKKVQIVEVGPRDGLQNEKEILDTETKLNYLIKLSDAGLTTLEVTSFVSPKAIPQMYDATELFQKISSKLKGTSDKKFDLPCLVPNLKGLDKAVEIGVKNIALFTATSDEFTKKNINATVDESFERMAAIADKAKSAGIKMRGYVSTAYGCPYSGDIGVEKLLKVLERLFKLGVYEVSIGDTIGIANPKQVDEYFEPIKKNFDVDKLAMHFHDTRGLALANILVSLEHGVSVYDSSSGGLGGCPYAKGASGNVATEDVVNLMHSMGIETGVDMAKLVSASQYILEKLQKQSPSKFYNTYLATDLTTDHATEK
jgi:hydroxymethylglutaryl-CoA lyase